MPATKPLWGDGSLEFARWETPFENVAPQQLSLVEVVWREADVTLLVSVLNPDPRKAATQREEARYRVSFGTVSAFRVLDEGGLIELWGEDWPGWASSRVRNHGWSCESLLSFTRVDEGWSYVIATAGDCVEVVSTDPPEITGEQS